ncbi:FAD-binding oxidoreductase [Rhodopseudomonas sp. B29]|uniref:NAD(P)/FAD-dependent oxidoreductase n=1 Tax=Rhodopseudomonas sp. B29 TaxID=95607 RepID=UPI0003B3FF6C
MTAAATDPNDGTDGSVPELPPVPERPEEPHARLTFDLDVDVCVVGAGLAGLSVALELAQSGLSVAVLEGRRVGWNASSHHLGSVTPGYGVPLDELIDRVGPDHARKLWVLSLGGMEIVRQRAAEAAMAGVMQSAGALEVSNVDIGDRLIARLQTLGAEFGTDVEGWQVERVRDVLKTDRYFHAISYPNAFQIDGRRYIAGLEAMARQAGVRIFEETAVIGIDYSGVRKRIATPNAKLRAADVVLAGNVHLGAAAPRLSDTLLPVWRYAAVTAPLGERLAEAIAFAGSIADTDGVDHYRIVEGDRLLWASGETTFEMAPRRLAGIIRRRIGSVFPQLGKVEISQTFGGVVGQTVHGMPQIGELRRGLWVASGFGRQGLAATAVAGRLIANGIVDGDDRWKLFSPFELVWAGGEVGRVVGQGVFLAARESALAAGVLARYRERAAGRARIKEARLEAAKRRAVMPRVPRPAPRPHPGEGGQDAAE